MQPKPARRSRSGSAAPRSRRCSRALRLDGWHGSRATPEQAPPMVQRLRAARPDAGFAISLRYGWDGRDAGALARPAGGLQGGRGPARAGRAGRARAARTSSPRSSASPAPARGCWHEALDHDQILAGLCRDRDGSGVGGRAARLRRGVGRRGLWHRRGDARSPGSWRAPAGSRPAPASCRCRRAPRPARR